MTWWEALPRISMMKIEFIVHVLRGKQVRDSFEHLKTILTTWPLKLLHMDLCGL